MPMEEFLARKKYVLNRGTVTRRAKLSQLIAASFDFWVIIGVVPIKCKSETRLKKTDVELGSKIHCWV